MSKMQTKTPNPQYDGGVSSGEPTDNPSVVGWFDRPNYTVGSQKLTHPTDSSIQFKEDSHG